MVLTDLVLTGSFVSAESSDWQVREFTGHRVPLGDTQDLQLWEIFPVAAHFQSYQRGRVYCPCFVTCMHVPSGSSDNANKCMSCLQSKIWSLEILPGKKSSPCSWSSETVPKFHIIVHSLSPWLSFSVFPPILSTKSEFLSARCLSALMSHKSIKGEKAACDWWHFSSDNDGMAAERGSWMAGDGCFLLYAYPIEHWVDTVYVCHSALGWIKKEASWKSPSYIIGALVVFLSTDCHNVLHCCFPGEIPKNATTHPAIASVMNQSFVPGFSMLWQCLVRAFMTTVVYAVVFSILFWSSPVHCGGSALYDSDWERASKMISFSTRCVARKGCIVLELCQTVHD